MTNTFASVVGQVAAKRKVNFYLEGYQRTRMMPYLMYTSQKGSGKTLMARETSKSLTKYDHNKKPVLDGLKKPIAKPFLEINAASIRSENHLINSVLIPNVIDKDITVFIDEAHNLRPDVTNAFLTILSPGADQTLYVKDDYICDFNHKRQTFIFATSEAQRVFPPLLDRMTRVDLESYTAQEMAEILQKHSKGITIEPSAAAEIVTVLRGNARAAFKMAQDIKTYVKGGGDFALKDWAALRTILGINPLGLNATEISILRYLAENTNGTSLTKLAAKTGLSRESVMRDYEAILLRKNFICIETSGRQITKWGMEYLKNLGSLV